MWLLEWIEPGTIFIHQGIRRHFIQQLIVDIQCYE